MQKITLVALATLLSTGGCATIFGTDRPGSAPGAAAAAPPPTTGVCAAHDLADGPRHHLIVEDPPVAKDKVAAIAPEGKPASAYVYAAVGAARGTKYADNELIRDIPAPLVHLVEASAARGEAKPCLDLVQSLEDDAHAFDAAWKAYKQRRATVDAALADARNAKPDEAEKLLLAVITPPPESGKRGRLETIDAETDALLALIPVVKATKHYALLGDVARGLGVRRHTTTDEAEERMLWLVGRDPAAFRSWSDAAANWGQSRHYVAAMNVATQRAAASASFGREMLAGISQHRSLLGLTYVDLLDTKSAKPGDVVAVQLSGSSQISDTAITYDFKNSWDQPHDCKATHDVCSWQPNGASFDAVFCQECQYKQVNARLSAKLSLSAPPPAFAHEGKSVVVVARVVSVKRVSSTEASWVFTDAQVVDDRLPAAQLAAR
jgi:hypothetical protein